ADDPAEIHAVRHRTHPVWGVQFHPESILTQEGRRLLANFLRLAASRAPVAS
ncbi:MAG: anthranilate/aminodeoxychorismate synthase component II, partial [Gemmatimonadetes bacterium]|nr:anthranilate/aminodeoxychorismate synthase component II [Gemmatimonadota bacterium]